MPKIFDLDIYERSKADLIEMIYSGACDPGSVVVTPNVDHLKKIDRDSSVKEIYRKATIFLVDGVPLLMLCRLLGYRSVNKISGAELMPSLLERQASDERRLRFGIIGGDEAEYVSEKLTTLYPSANILVHSPAMGFDPHGEEAEAVSDHFRSMKIDVVFVCLGMPKQEAWAEKFRWHCGAQLILCVGGALDFITGDQKRAPESISRIGLEWLWRLVHSPKRLWKRYLSDLLWIGPAFSREYFRHKRGDV